MLPHSLPVPEPSRDLHITDQEWVMVLYPQLHREAQWWLEFRFLEDRARGLKRPPLAVRFLRDPEVIAAHLQEYRELAALRARPLREGGDGPLPPALFWGVQPRSAQQGSSEHVAAFVALVCDIDCKDLTDLPEAERPRAAWERLHTAAPPPSAVTWTGHGFHAYWLLQEPQLDKQRGEEVQRAIARCLGGDHAWDCARLLRWPNSRNYKQVFHNECPAVRLVWWRPELRYDFKALEDHFQPFAQTPACPVEPAAEPLPAASRLLWKRFYRCLDRDSALKALWEGRPDGLDHRDRSTLDMALAHSLVRHQLAWEAFVTFAPQAPWNSQKTLGPGYLQRTWAKAVFRSPAAREANPEPDFPAAEAAGAGFLTTLPESAWTAWARLYREAVGDSTEAADELHYVALLAVLGTALGRTLTLFSGRPLHPNIYAMLIGPTGDRKSTAAELALDLLRRVAPEVLLLNGIGSQEGLMERMAGAGPGQGQARTLLFIDEMAALLKKGRRESSGSLIEFITELFHTPEAKAHYTRTKAIQLVKPTLSILAASTPAWLEAALEEDDILGGFTNRFIYVTGPSKPDNPLPAAPDLSKLETLSSWIRDVVKGPSRSLTWHPEARALWCDFYVRWRRFLVGQGERAAALLRRIDLYILKFASINAAMEQTSEIGLSHLRPALELGQFLAGRAYSTLSDLGAPRDYRIERLIEQKLLASQGSMRRKQLRQVLGGRVTGEKLDRILRAMERNGQLCQLDETTDKGLARLVKLTLPGS